MFERKKEQCGHKNEYQRCPQYDAGVQTEVFVIEFLVPNVAPYDVTHTAHNDESADGEVDECVAAVRGQGGEGGAAYAHEVEARVAERRYRVEYGKVYARARAEVLTEAYREQSRSHEFGCEGENQYALYQHDNTSFGEGACGMRHNRALEQSYSASESERHQRYEGHETYAAYLYEQHYDDLPEQVPVLEGVVDDETRDAGRGSRSQQGVDVGRPLTASVGKGEREQKTAEEDYAEIAEHKYLCRRRFAQKLGFSRFFVGFGKRTFLVCNVCFGHNRCGARAHLFSILSYFERKRQQNLSLRPKCANRKCGLSTDYRQICIDLLSGIFFVELCRNSLFLCFLSLTARARSVTIFSLGVPKG